MPIKNDALQYKWLLSNDRPIHRLDYQWQASIHFDWLMVGQNDVILYRHYKKLPMFELQLNWNGDFKKDLTWKVILFIKTSW